MSELSGLSELNELSIASIVFAFLTIISFIISVIPYSGKNQSSGKLSSGKLIHRYVLPVLTCIFAIITLSLGIASEGGSKPLSNFSNLSTNSFSKIGTGPLIDKAKISNWLNKKGVSQSNDSTTVNWKDVDGNIIPISGERFRSMYGYIPPSIAYYPMGQANKKYALDNFSEGREKCKQACVKTSCKAVQTEVPENCSQKSSVPGINSNSCGVGAELSCTLFYDGITNADDAYWTLKKECSDCVGRKYYENSSIPIELPVNTSKPSEVSPKYCDYFDSPSEGCIERPLLTTEYLDKIHPYYSLPISAYKADQPVSGSFSNVMPVIEYTNGAQTSCGLVGSELKSCKTKRQCDNNNDKSECYKVDEKFCNGTAFDEASGASELSAAKKELENGNKDKAYDKLNESCFYRQKITVPMSIQLNCDPKIVERGCYGSPHTLYTKQLTNSGSYAACSDNSAIPLSQRCQSGLSNLAECTNFPYSCGSKDNSNTLWLRNQ